MEILKKIVSGGQTGADRAALDTAIKFNIEHGGWVPAGRRAEGGAIPERYRLREMDSDSYPARTRQNIKDSQGTLIVARGTLSGGSLLTFNIAEKLGKPLCHIDLLDLDEFEAAVMVHDFIVDNAIEVLNVAGPRASHDPFIYRSVKAVLEALLYMVLMDKSPEPVEIEDFFSSLPLPEEKCTTVEDAVQSLIRSLSLRTRSVIANSRDSDIASLYFSLVDPMKTLLELDTGENTLLLDACKNYHTEHGDISSMDIVVDIEDAVMLILKVLKRFLEQDHVLRIVR